MKIVFCVLFVGYFSIQKVVSCPPNRFGPQCRFVCHCLDDVSCDSITGACPDECAPGWDGTTCQRGNVAYRRHVKQKDGKHSEDGALAIDDVMSTCSFTKPSVPGWWTVELDHPTRVETIRILSGPLTNIKNWSIYVGMDDTIFSMTLCTSIRIHGDGATVKCDVAVLGKYVMVVNKLGPVELCDFRIYVCSEFWFGNMCDNMCRCADESEVCDIETGACASGCSPGWSGEGCQTGCKKKYGMDCKYPCGNCVSDACDHVTGKCTSGCEPGWNGTYCDEECQNLRWGKNCAFECGHCHGNTTCDRKTGRCSKGCHMGYTGDFCDKRCRAGNYGQDCQFECGHCESNTSCDPVTGVCTRGCLEGWQGKFCTKRCQRGAFGRNCSSRCSHCRDGNCDVVTGMCQTGCSAGYNGRNCLNSCPVGHFGHNCTKTCPSCLVKNNEACDSISGRCLHGCQPGFNGTYCETSCPWGYYGEGCERCGVCKPSITCDVHTGKCPSGCGDGFYGDLCKQSDAFMDEDGPQLKIFLGVTITIVFGILLAVTTCLVLAWNREHLVEMPSEKTESTKEELIYRGQNGKVVSDANDVEEEEEEGEIIEYV